MSTGSVYIPTAFDNTGVRETIVFGDIGCASREVFQNDHVIFGNISMVPPRGWLTTRPTVALSTVHKPYCLVQETSPRQRALARFT